MDVVRIKCQILTALVRQREDEELSLQQVIQDAEEEEEKAFAFQEQNDEQDNTTTYLVSSIVDTSAAVVRSSIPGGLGEGKFPHSLCTSEEREKLRHMIQRGGMTPLEATSSSQRRRMTVMDHKRASGGKIIMPPPPSAAQRKRRRKRRLESAALTETQFSSLTQRRQVHLQQAPLLPQFKRSQQHIGISKAAASSSISPTTGKDNGTGIRKAVPFEGGSVVCTACTLINSLTALKCEVCESALHHSRDPEDVRHCSKCTMVNPPDAYRCEACNSRLPRGRRPLMALPDPLSNEGCLVRDPGLEEEEQQLQDAACESEGLSSFAGDSDAREHQVKRPQDKKDGEEYGSGCSDDFSDAFLDSTSTSTAETTSAMIPKGRRRGLGSSASYYRGAAGGKRRNDRVFGKTGLPDDFHEVDFQGRLRNALETMEKEEGEKNTDITADEGGENTGVSDATIHSSCGEIVVVMEGDIPIRKIIAKKLFLHQRTAVRWLGQLRESRVGGIIADEMGLGKTAQVAVYLAGLELLGLLTQGILIVCPATVLCHWQNELHRWSPTLRVILLHISGANFTGIGTSASRRARYTSKVLNLVGPLVYLTSYEGLRMLSEPLLSHHWDACILDEAQRVRNPDAQVTLLAKRLRSPHRIALTGTPIQNSLQELWSLFDFVYPGRLGALPAFEDEFIKPIRQGSYAGAGRNAIRLAYHSATALRSLISPYMLRRMKKDILEELKLPPKTEQVLFCRLTSEQRRIYEKYLSSDDVNRILQYGARDERGRCFRAISILRKLCNHPQLLRGGGRTLKDDGIFYGSASDEELSSGEELGEEETIGNYSNDPERSGKMQVLMKLMPQWKENGHKALIFCQTRSMLSIIQLWLTRMSWEYVRLDGNTLISSRQGLIDRFNNDPALFALIATTRTGGVGVNLVGADRVILFGPDWNPCTDAQARERPWRLGQTVPVTVYRLICSGTIEEKIYQRQVFKTAQANAVLSKKPRRRSNGLRFSHSELQDLFSLGPDDGPGYTEEKMEEELTREDDVNMVITNTNNESEKGGQQRIVEKEEAGVLRALFDSTPLSAAFAHDPEGEELSSTNDAEEVEMQAEVNEAVRQLKQSYHGQRDHFTPTWTGQSGNHNPAVATESSGKRFGRVVTASYHVLSGRRGGREEGGSATLLAEIGDRRQLVGGGGELGNNESAAMTKESSSSISNLQLARRLDAFFEAGRRCKTQEILEQFSDVPNSQAAHFRRFLRAVAVCKDGVWSKRHS